MRTNLKRVKKLPRNLKDIPPQPPEKNLVAM